ncbi:flagellar filament capping protein FliD [Nocardioides maradonensis]
MSSGTTTSATGAIQISGISSGLDTSSIISSLMAVESAPQTAIKNRVTAQQAQVSALQSINTALAAISTTSDSFRTGSTWTQLKATSSDSSVTVSATSAATQGNLSLTVNSIASSAQLGYASSAALTDVVATAGTTLQVSMNDGSVVSVDTGDGKLSTLITNLNKATGSSGQRLLQASAVDAGNGQVRLLVAAAATGAGSISVATSDGSTLLGGAVSVAGSDASVSLGAGITVTSSSNTFSSLLPGVSVTLGGATPVGTPIAITVADDGASRANGVNQFVKQINELMSQIGAQTKYSSSLGSSSAPKTNDAGILAGNQDLASVVNALRMTIFPSDGTSLASYGLDIDHDGNLTFDTDKFQAAYQADPSGVQAAFTGTDGWVSRVLKVSDGASLPASGTISQSIKAMNDRIASENDDIDAWDARLAMKQTALETMYTNLETTLSKLQSQQSWLTSALSSLDGGWSQNSSKG